MYIPPSSSPHYSFTNSHIDSVNFLILSIVHYSEEGPVSTINKIKISLFCFIYVINIIIYIISNFKMI